MRAAWLAASCLFIFLVSWGLAPEAASAIGNGVAAFGTNTSGQLGDGTTTDSTVPVPVGELGEATSISAGHAFGLALLQNETVMAWGSN